MAKKKNKKRITSIEQLTKEMNIKDVAEIADSDVNISKFGALLPDIETELATKILETLPDYRESCSKILNVLDSIYTKTLETNKKTQDRAMDSYDTVLEALKNQLEDESISSRERKSITNNMISIADRIAEINKSAQKHSRQVLKIILIALCAVVGIIFLPLGIFLLIVYFKAKSDSVR